MRSVVSPYKEVIEADNKKSLALSSHHESLNKISPRSLPIHFIIIVMIMVSHLIILIWIAVKAKPFNLALFYFVI